MTNQQAARVLRAAARTLREDGWCQGTLQDGGRKCAMGAVYEHVDVFEGLDIMDQVAAYLELPPGPTVPCTIPVIHPIPQWNDQKGRTKEEVIAAFEETANALDPVRELVPA